MVERTPVPDAFRSNRPKAVGAVPDGRYAVEWDDTLYFFRVNTPIEGKWAGFTFVEVFASDERYPVKGRMKKEVLEKIESDPKEAAIRFGKESRRCSICGRRLTRKESRERGIGPICAEERGW